MSHTGSWGEEPTGQREKEQKSPKVRQACADGESNTIRNITGGQVIKGLEGCCKDVGWLLLREKQRSTAGL